MESKRFIFSSGSYKKIRGRIEYDLHIVTYHSVSLRMELNIWQLQELFSKKAFSFFSKRLNSYVIAYNDVLPLTEAVYQVFHEIGHIYYGHISPGNSIAISLESQERVANHFAAFIFSKIGGAKIMKTLTGNEHFTYEGMPAGILLSDFWAWNSSDLLNNTLRGALAEFLVASAIGIDTSEARQDWTPYDLLSPSGRKSKSNAPHISRVGMLIVFQRYSSASAQLDHGIPKMTLAMMSKDGPTFMCSAYTQAKTGVKHRFSLNSGNFIFCLHQFLTPDARIRKAFPSVRSFLFLLRKLHTRN